MLLCCRTALGRSVCRGRGRNLVVPNIDVSTEIHRLTAFLPRRGCCAQGERWSIEGDRAQTATSLGYETILAAWVPLRVGGISLNAHNITCFARRDENLEVPPAGARPGHSRKGRATEPVEALRVDFMQIAPSEAKLCSKAEVVGNSDASRFRCEEERCHLPRASLGDLRPQHSGARSLQCQDWVELGHRRAGEREECGDEHGSCAATAGTHGYLLPPEFTRLFRECAAVRQGIHADSAAAHGARKDP